MKKEGAFYTCEVCNSEVDPNAKICGSCGAKFDGLLYDGEKHYKKDYLIKNPPKYVTQSQMPAYRKAVDKATHNGKKEVKFIVVASLFKKLKSAA